MIRRIVDVPANVKFTVDHNDSWPGEYIKVNVENEDLWLIVNVATGSAYRYPNYLLVNTKE